jgi:hypothetical protein
LIPQALLSFLWLSACSSPLTHHTRIPGLRAASPPPHRLAPPQFHKADPARVAHLPQPKRDNTKDPLIDSLRQYGATVSPTAVLGLCNTALPGLHLPYPPSLPRLVFSPALDPHATGLPSHHLPTFLSCPLVTVVLFPASAFAYIANTLLSPHWCRRRHHGVCVHCITERTPRPRPHPRQSQPLVFFKPSRTIDNTSRP